MTAALSTASHALAGRGRRVRRLACALLLAALPAACANATFDPANGDGGNGGGASPGGSGVAGGRKAAGAGGEAGVSAGSAGRAGDGGAAGKAGSGAGLSSGAGGKAGAAGGSSGKGGASGKGGSSGSAGASAAGKGGQAGSSAGEAGGSGKAGGAATTCAYAPSEGLAADDACYGCWNASVAGETCQAERAACDADVACATFFDCVIRCSGEDSSCAKKCDDGAETGKLLYESLTSCIVSKDCSPVCDAHAQEILTLDQCKHDVCTTGMILYRQCSPEAAAICEADATCCGGIDPKWGASCVAKAETAGFCPDAGCVHSPCAAGAPLLDPTCSPCVAAICALHPLCCSPLGKWDATCAGAVETVCAEQ